MKWKTDRRRFPFRKAMEPLPGVAISVFASLLLFLTGPPATGRPDWGHLHYWNVFMRFGVFAVVAYVVSMQAAIRRLLRREKDLPGGTILPGR